MATNYNDWLAQQGYTTNDQNQIFGDRGDGPFMVDQNEAKDAYNQDLSNQFISQYGVNTQGANSLVGLMETLNQLNTNWSGADGELNLSPERIEQILAGAAPNLGSTSPENALMGAMNPQEQSMFQNYKTFSEAQKGDFLSFMPLILGGALFGGIGAGAFGEGAALGGGAGGGSAAGGGLAEGLGAELGINAGGLDGVLADSLANYTAGMGAGAATAAPTFLESLTKFLTPTPTSLATSAATQLAQNGGNGVENYEFPDGTTGAPVGSYNYAPATDSLWGNLLTSFSGPLATLISSGFKTSAANDAAGAQGAAAQLGIEEQRRQFDAVRALLQPYVSAGTGALTGQQNLLGLNGATAQQGAYDMLQNSPAFTSLTKTGENAILQNASATGGLRGGNTQAALAQFRPALLAQMIDSQFKNLGGLTGIGANAAAGVGNVGMQTGTNVTNLLQQQGAAQAGAALAGGRSQAEAIGALGGGLGLFAGMGGFNNLFG